MERRIFIKNTALVTSALATGLTQNVFALSEEEITLTVLHTNDMHSRIDPFPANDRRNGGKGGMARRASLIQKMRETHNSILLLDAGDIFQGTPYFNFFGGELEFKLMSKMKYDAATMGNHDFDAGIEGFVKQLPNANFPFIVSNYSFSDETLKQQVLPYKIFRKGKIKVGVFGLGIELKGLVGDKLYKGTQYLSPTSVAKEMVQELEKKKCDLIICLSHLGNKYSDETISDHSLAKEVSGIDLIIGGHTHTFMNEPSTVVSKEGHATIIHQAGWGGIRLGKLDFVFKKGKKTFKKGKSFQEI